MVSLEPASSTDVDEPAQNASGRSRVGGLADASGFHGVPLNFVVQGYVCTISVLRNTVCTISDLRNTMCTISDLSSGMSKRPQNNHMIKGK